MGNCKCVLTSDQSDFEERVSKLLEQGYKILTSRYVCYISNFVWYAILVKGDCE